jgi:hypothetical protein
MASKDNLLSSILDRSFTDWLEPLKKLPSHVFWMQLSAGDWLVKMQEDSRSWRRFDMNAHVYNAFDGLGQLALTRLIRAAGIVWQH